MRYYQLQESNLEEGGKEFEAAGVVPIPADPEYIKRVYQKAVGLLPPVLRKVDQHFRTGSTEAVASGNAGPHITESGDMDIMIDIDLVIKLFQIQQDDPKKAAPAAKKALEAYIKQSSASAGIPDLVTSVYSINVGMALPIDDVKHQVDFELVKNAHQVHQFHRHYYHTPGYKGVHKQRLLASIARNTKTNEHPYGLAWSAFEGLKDRAADPKKPDSTKITNLITSHPQEVAELLLGAHSSVDDLRDVNSILAALARNSRDEAEYESKIEDARNEFTKDEKTPPLLSYQDALRV